MTDQAAINHLSSEVEHDVHSYGMRGIRYVMLRYSYSTDIILPYFITKCLITYHFIIQSYFSLLLSKNHQLSFSTF